MNTPSELRQILALLAKEHRQLSDAVQDLATLLAIPTVSIAKILSILQRISITANKHFASEESVMDDLKYPRLSTHRLNHQWFQTFIADYQDGLMSGSIRINDDARRNLPNLICFYVGCRDDEFQDWLVANQGWSQVPVWFRTAQAIVQHL